jgi:hypothetical protein
MEKRKIEKSSMVDSTISEDKLLLTIENTPEDRLDLLQQMTKLKLSLQKAKAYNESN